MIGILKGMTKSYETGECLNGDLAVYISSLCFYQNL